MTANVPEPINSNIVRLMIHDAGNGVYLFGYDKLADSGGLFDDWYETVEDAQDAASREYQVAADAWAVIADPLEDCQQDWIQPVRVKGRDIGQPQYGQLERLVNGNWEDFVE
ncbi:hypothetical protein MUN81_01595 [Hymenobacter sp. 5317J-9]|uniref:hypothetical protein n=1 Tax=Hymenobacter sp. 5317J-9 TaxID=2932250 RepID=UPI001FD674DF|nr:hypothetical protein [Hymenobacter sp. 5317J-9]UOQ98199.1 hypothetical protein MUN81_01595 [Hymenobacter sp. 5317J-9]